MKIALKAIKYAAFSSEETNCYSANLYVDGRKIGTVGNDGRGGCDRFQGDRDVFAAVDAWCRANLPRWTGAGGEALDIDLELHCGALLGEWLVARHLRSSLRANVVFVHPRDRKLYWVRHRGAVERTAAAVTRRHPGATILNGQSFDEALALYREAAAG